MPLKKLYEDHPLNQQLFTQARAADGVQVKNTGSEVMMVLKVFGPDNHPDIPRIPRRWKQGR